MAAAVGVAVAVAVVVLVRLIVDVTGPFQPSTAASDVACEPARLSLWGRAAQYERMVLRIKMMKERMRIERRIH